MKKLKDKELLRRIIDELEKISEDPYRGEDKKQDLKGVWGWSFNYAGVAYRIAYMINADERHIIVFAIGPHEMFWEQVKGYWRNYKRTVKNKE